LLLHASLSPMSFSEEKYVLQGLGLKLLKMHIFFFLVSMEMVAVSLAKVLYVTVSRDYVRIASVANSTPLLGKHI
jgi:hypothetical protein